MLYCTHRLVDESLHEPLVIQRPPLVLILSVADSIQQAGELIDAVTSPLPGSSIREMVEGPVHTAMISLGLLDAGPGVYALSMNSIDCPLGRLRTDGGLDLVAWRDYRTFTPLQTASA